MDTTRMVECTCTPAQPGDVAAVATLFGELHRYNASLNERFALAERWEDVLHEHFLRTCHSTSSLWLLAHREREPIGLLVLEQHSDSPLFRHRLSVELVALYVVPLYRRSGLAQRLMAEAKAWTAQHGVSCMQLYVTVQNEHARSFYRRCGWSPAQEVWHIDIKPDISVPTTFSDPSCDTERADLLERGHHHLAMEIETDDVGK